MKTVGILTGGGDCPGLNAVVRAVAKSLLGKGYRVTGFKDGFAGFVDDRHVDINDAYVSGILTRGGTVLGTSNTANPFKYTLPPYGTPDKPADLSELVRERFAAHNMAALVAIGGDGTLSMARRIKEMGLPVIGVPKTIDNDLAATDVTFGFDSAMYVATDAIDKLHTTAQSHHRIMVLETMGRYAGWIALRAGIAGGGDVILIPEIPYREELICAAVMKRRERGKTFSIVVAAEGAANESGEMAVAKTVKGSPDPVRLGGIGYRIAADLEKSCGMETRVVVLGHLQRGGIPTPYDRWLATRFGVRAAELVAQGLTGNMVALRGTSVEYVPIEEAVQKLRRVDPAGEEVRMALETGVSFASAKVG